MFFYDNINVKENVFFQSASWKRDCLTHWRERRGWDLVSFDWLVLSMRIQVILDSSFARPGSAPLWGGKKGEFRDWTMFRVFHLEWSTWPAAKTFVASWRNAVRWLVDLLGHEQICCATCCEFDEKRATKPIIRIKIGWKHYQTVNHTKWEPQVGRGLSGIRLQILHIKFQFSKSIKSSTFHIFLNLIYPLRKKNISFPKCPKITQKFTQNRQTVVNEISREI